MVDLCASSYRDNLTRHRSLVKRETLNVEVYGGNHSPWVQAVLLAIRVYWISPRQVPPIEAMNLLVF